jgi:hypothetical protein
MSHTNFPLLRTLSYALLAAGLLAAVPPVLALNQFLKDWQDTYPGSTTDNASCALCHGTANTNLNAYGKDLCNAFGGSVPADIAPALGDIEGLNSDQDPSGSSNIDEIYANAQPGWTDGAVNQIYKADVGGGCLALGSPISVPSAVPLPYDRPLTATRWRCPAVPIRGT